MLSVCWQLSSCVVGRLLFNAKSESAFCGLELSQLSLERTAIRSLESGDHSCAGIEVLVVEEMDACLVVFLFII